MVLLEKRKGRWEALSMDVCRGSEEGRKQHRRPQCYLCHPVKRGEPTRSSKEVKKRRKMEQRRERRKIILMI